MGDILQGIIHCYIIPFPFCTAACHPSIVYLFQRAWSQGRSPVKSSQSLVASTAPVYLATGDLLFEIHAKIIFL